MAIISCFEPYFQFFYTWNILWHSRDQNLYFIDWSECVNCRSCACTNMFFPGIISNAVVLQPEVRHESIGGAILLLDATYYRRLVSTKIRNSEAYKSTRWRKRSIQFRQLHGVLPVDNIDVCAELFCRFAAQRYSVQVWKGNMTRHLFTGSCFYEQCDVDISYRLIINNL